MKKIAILITDDISAFHLSVPLAILQILSRTIHYLTLFYAPCRERL